MQKIVLLFSLFFTTLAIRAQDQKSRAITQEEYVLAKTATVKDLDKDTYVKLNQKYVLDRYEMKKPYFITGDDGKRKRIDLYRFVARDSMQELGTLFIYTNETGKRYTACLPSVASDGKIWERYFEDIHAIDKEEANFVLKLSYVLSREFSSLLGKASGKGAPKEDGNYGNEICFPGNEEVLLANGSRKSLADVLPGEEVVSVDPVTHQTILSRITQKAVHEPKNYAITTLLLVKEELTEIAQGYEVMLQSKRISATPNHPVAWGNSSIEIGAVPVGASLLCEEAGQKWSNFSVLLKYEKAMGVQPVYNLESEKGTTLVIGGVVLLQKQPR